MNYTKTILFYIALVVSSLLISCFSDKDESIISREKFIDVVTDLHIADAVLTEKSLYDRKLKDSTESYYNYILVKHNLSRIEFDENLIFYSKDMADFSLIYDQVIENIKAKNNVFKRRQSIFNLPLVILDSINLATKSVKKNPVKQELWTTKKEWSLPEDGRLNTIKFEKVIYGQSKFELSAEIMILKKDLTINPTMLMYIYYKDGSNSTFKDTTLIKDGKWKKHLISAKTNPKKVPAKIVCKIVDHDSGTRSKHLKVRNISLLKIPIVTEPQIPENLPFKRNNIRIIEKSK